MGVDVIRRGYTEMTQLCGGVMLSLIGRHDP